MRKLPRFCTNSLNIHLDGVDIATVYDRLFLLLRVLLILEENNVLFSHVWNNHRFSDYF